MLNAAAYTAVDAAETPDGRRTAWAANAGAPGHPGPARRREHRFTLVHYSTEYVFDGTAEPHTEDEPLSPLGVYAQTKAAGDIAVGDRAPPLRPPHLLGDRRRQQLRRAPCSASPTTASAPRVVDDQVGRLTFTEELARATRHLLDVGAAYGTYNVSNGGDPMSWADIAKAVFALSGRSPDDVTPVTHRGVLRRQGRLSPRPLRSVMDLSKIEATGFMPEDALAALALLGIDVQKRPAVSVLPTKRPWISGPR